MQHRGLEKARRKSGDVASEQTQRAARLGEPDARRLVDPNRTLGNEDRDVVAMPVTQTSDLGSGQVTDDRIRPTGEYAEPHPLSPGQLAGRRSDHSGGQLDRSAP